ncbi:MAG: hypothetical protein ACRD96_06955 [Bryobacteraceae bacterium]
MKVRFVTEVILRVETDNREGREWFCRGEWTSAGKNAKGTLVETTSKRSRNWVPVTLGHEGANLAPTAVPVTEDIDMTHLRAFAMAGVASFIACADNPSTTLAGPLDPYRPAPPAPSTATIAGRISVVPLAEDQAIELHGVEGGVYRLLGNASDALASVQGADVVVRGTFDANGDFVVQEFEVTGMYGRPALDGLLEATDEGFALRRTDGLLLAVPGLPADCAEYVGQRLWVIGWDYDPPVQCGVIAG